MDSEPTTPDWLTPAQRETYDQLLIGLAAGDVCVLQGDAGSGKSAILRTLQNTLGGERLRARDFMNALMKREPAALEEAFFDLLDATLAANQLVLVDDLHLITKVVNGYDYPRAYLLDTALAALLNEAELQHKKLVFSLAGDGVPDSILQRGYAWEIEDFQPEDYRAICLSYLGPLAEKLDYQKVHRYAPSLNAYQLRNACRWMRQSPVFDTEQFVEHLMSRNLTSNVDLNEVQPVSWTELKGVDNIIAELEAKVALPFENDALASEFKLKAKRGVLLAGPPGTGKTTIGRALAHRLKSKFFLIDGTAISGTNDFYEKIEKIFDAAKRNAPSIIFIDDADIIFEGKDNGFYRYLLTMMDGLESTSAERVCVMMTAMEAGSLPPAILRSGRVELWLETRLPDENARYVILRDKLSQLPEPFPQVDAKSLARASRGLTGADLKAILEDGKLLFAHSLSLGEAPQPLESYFLKAIAAVRAKGLSHKKHNASFFSTVPFGFKVDPA